MSKKHKKVKSRRGTRETICLNMIVKNEAHIITETLDTVKKYIDYWVICDTGSVDNTKEIIIDYFKKENIPGNLIEEPWADHFGYNRTVALKACKNKADYIWVIDADDLVVGDLKFPKKMNADCYMFSYGSGFTYKRTQVFKNKLNWKYVCVRHEYPKCDKTNLTTELIKSCYIDSRRLGDRSKDPKKYLKDALAMERCIKTEPEHQIRYKFYIGQSYLDYGDYDKSIYWYNERVKMGGWKEEVYYSYYRIAKAKELKNNEWEDIQKAYMAAWKFLPTRIEPLHKIAEHYRKSDDFETAYRYAKIGSGINYPTDQSLFLFKDVYDWKIWDELSVSSYYVGKYQESVDAAAKALDSGMVPSYEIERLKETINFSKNKLVPPTTNNKKILVFYVGYSEFTDNYVYGSELALLSLGKELSTNYNIFVVGPKCSNKKGDINFMDVDNFRNFPYSIDVLIVSRYIHYFMEFNITARKTFIWVHDTTFHYAWKGLHIPSDGKYLINNLINEIDGIVVLTDWHKSFVIKKYNLPEDKIYTIGNGLNDKYYNKQIKTIEGRFIYTSDPSRGLMELIDYFHDIHKEFPHTELYVYRGKDSFKNNNLLDIMKKYNYIHYGGKITQEEVAEKFVESDVWLYPTQFTETYCMSALEALRGGCYCIASDLAALKDTIGDRGVLVLGNTKTESTKKLFINEVRSYLQGKTKNSGIEWAKEQTWDRIAKQWISLFSLNPKPIDDWVCVSGVDSYGYDISYIGYQNIETLKEMASMMDDCVGFNSYGYFKKHISPNEKWVKIPDIKLYIKKDKYIPPVFLNDIINIPYGNDVSDIGFYIINLPYRKDRRTNITKRMEKYNLSYEFIQAETKESSLTKYYSWNSDHLNNMGKGYNREAEFACFASHLKAIRKFVDSGNSYGIIMEDDVTLREGFNEILSTILNNISDAPLVLLCVSNRKPYLECDTKHGKPKDNCVHLIKMDWKECWGALGYIISKEYALKVLGLYDKPFNRIDPTLLRIKNRVTSELITMNSQGYYTYPPLVLEELSLSDINNKNPKHHEKLFEWCVFENYN